MRKTAGLGKKQTAFFPGYQRALIKWYIDEMAALERHFRERYPQASYFEIDIEMMNAVDEMQRLCDFFGISIKIEDVGSLGSPVNLKR